MMVDTMSRTIPPLRRFVPALSTLAVGAVLLGSATACGSDNNDPVEPARPYTTPSSRTVNPTPTFASGEEETLTIAQSTQGTVLGLRIGVQSVGDGEASLSVTEAAGEGEEGEGVTGSEGDSFELDNGYTVAIDEVTEVETSSDVEGGESGSVTLTVKAPEGEGG